MFKTKPCNTYHQKKKAKDLCADMQGSKKPIIKVKNNVPD